MVVRKNKRIRIQFTLDTNPTCKWFRFKIFSCARLTPWFALKRANADTLARARIDRR